MLPFRHIRGYTIFPKAIFNGDYWLASLDVIADDNEVTQYPIPGTFTSQETAQFEAAVDAASLANLLNIPD